MKVFQWCKTDHVGNIHQYRPAWTTIQLQCNGSDASNVELPASEVIEVIEGYHQSSSLFNCYFYDTIQLSEGNISNHD